MGEVPTPSRPVPHALCSASVPGSRHVGTCEIASNHGKNNFKRLISLFLKAIFNVLKAIIRINLNFYADDEHEDEHDEDEHFSR